MIDHFPKTGPVKKLSTSSVSPIQPTQSAVGNTSVLLLDEPTNHLDLESVHWLEDYLLKYEGCLIVISHDRHFLNEICTHVADIDYETVITYTGGYDDMVLAKTQIRARVEAQNAQREKNIAQLNEFIARFSAGTIAQTACPPVSGVRRAMPGTVSSIPRTRVKRNSQLMISRNATRPWGGIYRHERRL